MKVCVAEDDCFSPEGLVEILEAESSRVIAAVDVADAIRLFKEQSTAFVCLDNMMLCHSGNEAKMDRERPQDGTS